MYLKRKIDDFLLDWKNELIPVEFKLNDKQSKSLQMLIKNDKYSDIKHGIKFGDFNIGCVNNIYTFPYFCAFLLKKYLKKFE